MLRRNLNNIVYLTLLIAFAVPYGVFVGAIQAPLWLHLVMTGVACLVIASAVDPLSRAILHRIEDREAVRRDAAWLRAKAFGNADAPPCAHCGFPVINLSVSAPSRAGSPIRHWHADRPACREAFDTARTRGAAS